MFKKITKKTVSVLLLVCIVAAGFSIPCFAAVNDAFGFSIDMLPSCARNWDRDAATTLNGNRVRLRDGGPSVPWRVKMTYDEEGVGCKAKFCLISVHNDQYSDYVTATQGTTWYYKSAYELATNQKVELGCANNNDSSKSYWVSGYWDEECNWPS